MSSKKYPGIGDDRSPIEKVHDYGMHYGKLAIGLAPIGIGLQVGLADAASKSRSFSTMTPSMNSANLNSTVGANLHAVSSMKNKLREQKVASIKGELIKELETDDLLKSIQRGEGGAENKLQALLNVLSSALDDPDIVAQGDKTSVNKEQLLELMQREISDIEKKDIDMINRLTEEIATISSQKAYEITKYKMSQYGDISSQLTPASSTVGLPSPYQIAENHAMSKKTMARAKQVYDMVGASKSGGAISVQAVAIKENAFGGGVGEYLKISMRNRDAFLIPTNLSNVRQVGKSNVIRTRGGAVTHAAPAAFIDASALMNRIGSLTQQELAEELTKSRSGGLATNYEDFGFDMFLKRYMQAGNIYNFNTSKYFSEMSQFTDQVFPGTTSATASADANLRAQLFSSQVKIMGMQNLTKEEKHLLVSNLGVKHFDIFEPFANVSKYETSLSGNQFTSVGLRAGKNGVSYEGMKISSVTDQMIQLPGVNRVIDPLSARPQQQYNTMGQFEMGKGAFFIDYKGGAPGTGSKAEALDRLGFGDGQGYIMNQSPVREVTVKSVMSGSSLKRSNVIFGEEIVQRARQNEADRVLRMEMGGSLKLYTEKARVALAESLSGQIDKSAYDELIKTGKFTFSGSASEYKGQVNAFFSAFGGRKEPGIVLGMKDDRVITIPKFKGISSFEINFNSIGKEGGREIIKMDLATSVDAGNINKVFSTMSKITGRSIDERGFNRTMGLMGFDVGGLFDVSKMQESIILTDSSMAKKSVYNANFQMASALTYFKRRRGNSLGALTGNIEESLSKEIEKGLANYNIALERNKKTGKRENFIKLDIDNLDQNQNIIRRGYSEVTIRSILQEAKDASLGAKEMGLIFGGLSQSPDYFGFEKMKPGSTYNEGMLFFKEEYETIFKKAVPQAVLDEINKGVGYAYDNIYGGPRSTMNRRNVGKTSQRTTMYLQQKLKAAGFNDEAISDFMFSYLSRRTDLDDNIVITNRLGQMGMSMAGEIGAEASMYMDENLKRVNVFDFIKQASASEEDAMNFLRGKNGEFAEGFLLDFSAPQGASQQQIEAARKMQMGVSRHTKAGDTFYMAAGDEFMDAVRRFGTDIEKTEGTSRIAPTYVKRVHSFANDLIKLQGVSLKSKQELISAQESILNFKKEIGAIFGESFHRISKGEQAGSSYSQVSFLQIAPDGMSVKTTDPSALGNIVNTSSDITIEQEAAFRRIFKHTEKARKPSIMFYDTQAFMSSFSSLEDGLKEEFYKSKLQQMMGKGMEISELQKADIKTSAAQKAQAEAGRIFKSFFLGTHQVEMGLNAAPPGQTVGPEGFRGFTGINVRNPDLGPGHVNFSSGYRNLQEIKFDAKGNVIGDEFFDAFARTKKGQESIAALHHQFGFLVGTQNLKIKSFQDIARLKQLDERTVIKPPKIESVDDAGNIIIDPERQLKAITRETQEKSINNFFSNLAHVSMNELDGEGGGRTIFPSFLTEVHYGKEKFRLDFAMSGAMLADADGDINNLFITSKKMIDELGQTRVNEFNQLIADQLAHTYQVQFYKQMSDQGMKEYGTALRNGMEMTGEMRVVQDILKEHGGKNIGPLDVTFGALRQGGSHIGDSRGVNSLLSALVSVQEAGNIKGKKLDMYYAFEEKLNQQLRALIESDGATKEELSVFLKKSIFAGQEETMRMAAAGQGTIDTSAIFDEDIRKMVNKSFQDTKLLTVDEMVESLVSSAKIAKSRSLIEAETVSRTGRLLSDTPTELRRMLYNTIPGQMATGSFDTFDMGMDRKASQLMDMADDVLRNTSSMRRSLSGPLALGALGSMAASALIGYEGYSPEPMLMPGEVSDYGVGNAIRNQSIYDNMTQGPAPEELIARQNNAMIDRPINDSYTRAEVASAYSIHGEAVSAGHGQAMMQNTVMRGGRGHMIINDTRLPITRNYINRLLGE